MVIAMSRNYVGMVPKPRTGVSKDDDEAGLLQICRMEITSKIPSKETAIKVPLLNWLNHLF